MDTLTRAELSNVMRDYMALFEGDVRYLYLDQSGYLTIGRGHLVSHFDQNQEITKQELDKILSVLHNNLIKHFLEFSKYPPTAQMAMLDMAFQHGVNNIYYLDTHPEAKTKAPPKKYKAVPHYINLHRAILSKNWLAARKEANAIDLIFNWDHKNNRLNARGQFREQCFKQADIFQKTKGQFLSTHITAKDFQKQQINPYQAPGSNLQIQGIANNGIYASPAPVGLIDNSQIPFHTLPMIDMRLAMSSIKVNSLLSLQGDLGKQLIVTSFSG